MLRPVRNMSRTQSTVSEQQPLFTEPEVLPAIHREVPCDLQSIVRSFSRLPSDIRTAAFAHVEGRLLNRELLDRLTSQFVPASEQDDWNDRIKNRKAALTPHLGKWLFCVVIRLPGVHYTIEVEYSSKQVVHWEWHAI